MGVAFWVVACVGINGLLHYLQDTAWGLLLGVVLVMLATSLLAVPLRYAVGAGLLASWLDYVALTGGEERSAVEAALIGAGLVLWSFWERWRDKIRMAPEQPPIPPDNQI